MVRFVFPCLRKRDENDPITTCDTTLYRPLSNVNRLRLAFGREPKRELVETPITKAMGSFTSYIVDIDDVY